MLSHVVTAWKSGLRGRTFHAVFLFALLMLFVAWLAAAFSARQPQAVALDVGLSGIRVAMTFMVLIWVQELVAREIDRRTVFFVLAYPQARFQYLVGRYLGIVSLAWVALSLLAALLVGVIQLSAWGYKVPHGMLLGLPYWVTIAGFALDLTVVAAFTLMIATVSTSTIMPLAMGFAFAIAARMLGPALQFLASDASKEDKVLSQASTVIDWVKYIVPDLDRFDWRTWPLYGMHTESNLVWYAVLMATCFSVIALAIGSWAFNRRQFT